MIDGRVVRHELVLAGPPDLVFDHLTDPAKLTLWIGIGADLEPEAGGLFRFEVAPGQYCEGTFLEVDRPRRLVLAWGWREPALGVPPRSSRVEVDLSATSNGGTLLHLCHHLPTDDAARLHDDGWTAFLARLQQAISGEPLSDYPRGDPEQQLHRLRTDRAAPLAE